MCIMGGKTDLIVENAAKVIAIRKNVRLTRKIRAARIYEVDTRKVVLLRNLLGTQVLLDRDGVVGTAFHRLCCVVLC